MPPSSGHEGPAETAPGSRSIAATNLPIVEESQATGEVAALYERYRTEFGRLHVPGILQCFATHPPLLRCMIELAQSLLFAEGHLTRRHKEMIATFLSSRNQCPYCADSHGYFLRMQGASEETLCALQQNDLQSTALSAAEQSLLRFVDRVNTESQSISRADADHLRQAGWTAPQLAEAVHLAALFAMFNRVVNAFGLAPQGLLAQSDGQP